MKARRRMGPDGRRREASTVCLHRSTSLRSPDQRWHQYSRGHWPVRSGSLVTRSAGTVTKIMRSAAAEAAFVGGLARLGRPDTRPARAHAAIGAPSSCRDRPQWGCVALGVGLDEPCPDGVETGRAAETFGWSPERDVGRAARPGRILQCSDLGL